jgi:hypothetical protein
MRLVAVAVSGSGMIEVTVFVRCGFGVLLIW